MKVQRKSVLRISSDLYPETVGGLGVHVDRLSSGQTRLGWKNTLLTTSVENMPKQENRNGYSIVRVPYVIEPFGNKIGLSIVKELIEQKNSHSIVHTHSHLFFSSNIVALINFLTTNPPMIITCHGVRSQSAPSILQDIYLHTLGLMTLNSAMHVLCYTLHEKNELIRLGVKPEKIVVIPNGIDTSFFKPIPKTDESRRILWVGRFVRGKRPDLAIEAFAKMKKEFPQLSLTMLGRGPDKEPSKRLVQELGLSDSVNFLSFVPEEEMPSLYSESLCLINTSEQEGVPRTILESLSCETPVIAPDLPQLVPIVRGSGLIFRQGDVNDLTSKIHSLLNKDELRDDLGKTGRLRVVRNHSWDNYVKKTIELYETVLDKEESVISNDRASHFKNITLQPFNIKTKTVETQKHWKEIIVPLIGIYFLALSLRLALTLWLGEFLPFGDPDLFLWLVDNPSEIMDRYLPVFPYLLVLIKQVTGLSSFTVVRFASQFISSLCVFPAYFSIKEFTSSHKCGLVSSLFVAITEIFVIEQSYGVPRGLALVLFFSVFYFLFKYINSGRIRHLVYSSLLYVILGFTHNLTTAMLIFPILTSFPFLVKDKQKRFLLCFLPFIIIFSLFIVGPRYIGFIMSMFKKTPTIIVKPPNVEAFQQVYRLPTSLREWATNFIGTLSIGSYSLLMIPRLLKAKKVNRFLLLWFGVSSLFFVMNLYYDFVTPYFVGGFHVPAYRCWIFTIIPAIIISSIGISEMKNSRSKILITVISLIFIISSLFFVRDITIRWYE
jgi:glycosyltransferase involved in cell wall biosynthesis